MNGEPAGRSGHGLPRGVRRGFTYLLILTLILAVANLLFTSRQAGIAGGRASAQCQFDADLGAAPVTPDPRTGRPSLLGVTIIADARAAWHQAACPGQLAPPSPAFRQWARYYRLPSE